MTTYIGKSVVSSALVFMLALCLCIPVWGDTFTEDYNGSLNTDYSLVRDSRTLQLEEGMTLREGDEVKVLSKQPNIYISLVVGDCEVVITTPQGTLPASMVGKTQVVPVKSSYVVKNNNVRVCQDSSGNSKVLESGQKEHDLMVVATKGKCVTSGVPLSIPMLQEEKNDGKWVEKDNVKIAAKTDSHNDKLYLGWNGGVAPYKIEVSQLLDGKAGKKKPKKFGKTGIQSQGECKEMELKEVEVVLGSNEKFEKGEKYQVTITDNQQFSQTGKFTVVDQKSKAVEELIKKCDTFAPALSAACIAKELACHSNGEWVLEAYQKLVVGKSHSAKLARLGLAEGSLSPRLQTPK